MSESQPGDQEAIELAFFWDELLETFQANAFVVGIQSVMEQVCDQVVETTRLVLEAEPTEDFRLQLWATMDKERLIGSVSVFFYDLQGADLHSYQIQPGSISQDSVIQTALDQEDLQDLRDDVARAQWDEVASKRCAQEPLFFS